MNEAILIITAIILSAIPSGLWIAKIFSLPDPRNIASGNIGASNLTRIGGTKAGALTLLFDFIKGFTPCFIAKIYFQNDIQLGNFVFFLCTLSHCYSIFLKFKGGKGVATAAGCIFALSPVLGILGLCSWLLVFYCLKISSVAALISIVVICVFSFVAGDATGVQPLFTALVTILIIRRHETNLGLLLGGKERYFL